MIHAEMKNISGEPLNSRVGRTGSQRRLAVVGMVVEDRRESGAQVRKILDAYSHLILLRNGVPCGKDDVGVVSVIVYADAGELGSLTGKLSQIQDVRVRSVTL